MIKKSIHCISQVVLSVAVGACISSCGGRPQQSGEKTATDSAVVRMQPAPDSTLYGVSDEFGMSTFTLITRDGDTLYLDRDHADGSPAHIYGDLDYGAHYALTTADNGQSIETLINVDQLKRYFKQYKLYNGRVVLNQDRDTVCLVQLSDRFVEYRDKAGKSHRLQP